MPELRTLLVHRDPTARERIAGLLRGEGLELRVAAGAGDGAGTLTAQPLALVVADEATAAEGLADACLSLTPSPLLVVLSESAAAAAGQPLRGTGTLAVRADDEQALREAVQSIAGRRVNGKAPQSGGLDAILGPSKEMMELRALAGRLAASRVPILLRGEAGTGRELLARAIHAASPRAAGPFIVIDCATLPARVLETELFGGAPTAASAPAALLRQAEGGTLYLHEVTGASPGLSARLLHVLAAGAARAEGQPIDVRLIGSTREEPRTGGRSDVAARLDVTTLRIPPLRERPEDVPVLAQHFANRHGRPATLSAEVQEVLRAYPWPGNVRELEQAVAHALALSSGAAVLPENLPPNVRGEGRAPVAGRPGQRPTLQELERRYAIEVLRETGGNKSRTAEILGIDCKTLYRLLGLTPPPPTSRNP
ncbi:MAG: sigma 54-interacting transcriptional regulator [Anaeromyxobacteraceae bacterium]